MPNSASVAIPLKPMPSFHEVLSHHGVAPLNRSQLRELQINVGKLCNQACEHCHVEAGPKRTEIMSWETMQQILHWARDNHIEKVDITGGAPELNPHFRQFVDGFLQLDTKITVRCNLTVMFEPGQHDLAEWYAERNIRLVCSLPCYSQENVDDQRGKGVFDKSILAIQRLNEAGYATQPALKLDLVYNPNGPFLPPEQEKLQQEYKQRLFDEHGLRFNDLLTLTNLPINRFAHFLQRIGQTETYHELLIENFNPQTVSALMCRHLISIDWTGRVYDCDFNQMLEMPIGAAKNQFLWEIHSHDLTDNDIAVGPHCFGCTAGSGSSCGGALT